MRVLRCLEILKMNSSSILLKELWERSRVSRRETDLSKMNLGKRSYFMWDFLISIFLGGLEMEGRGNGGWSFSSRSSAREITCLALPRFGSTC